MGAIRNVGANDDPKRRLPPARRRAATSPSTTSKKVPLRVCNKRTIESLIKAGAFDDLGHRRSLSLIHEAAVDAVVAVREA